MSAIPIRLRRPKAHRRNPIPAIHGMPIIVSSVKYWHIMQLPLLLGSRISIAFSIDRSASACDTPLYNWNSLISDLVVVQFVHHLYATFVILLPVFPSFVVTILFAILITNLKSHISTYSDRFFYIFGASPFGITAGIIINIVFVVIVLYAL